ncbi:Universal stress protein A-like protein [Bienertia sinuspersici]
MMAALIPMAELCKPEVMDSYGVEIEPEVLDLLRTISTQLQVNVVWKFTGEMQERKFVKLLRAFISIIWSWEAEASVKSKGYSKHSSVLMGSVTSYVLEHASCPVTVVKDRGNEC